MPRWLFSAIPPVASHSRRTKVFCLAHVCQTRAQARTRTARPHVVCCRLYNIPRIDSHRGTCRARAGRFVVFGGGAVCGPLAVGVAALVAQYPGPGGCLWTRRDFGVWSGFLCFWVYLDRDSVLVSDRCSFVYPGRFLDVRPLVRPSRRQPFLSSRRHTGAHLDPAPIEPDRAEGWQRTEDI